MRRFAHYVARLTVAGVLSRLAIGCANATTPQPPFAQTSIADDVFYQIMPITWRDSDSDGGLHGKRFGDFNGMTASLPYLKSLGVTAVWMTPIYPSGGYHGYMHGPINQLNPWFGKEADFLRFVAQAHKRGIKVFLDAAVYGISTDSAIFRDARDNPRSKYSKMLAFKDARNNDYYGIHYDTWDGTHHDFIDWDFRNLEARKIVTGWCAHWLDPHGDGSLRDGIDGFRLDHVLMNGDTGPEGLGYTLDNFWKPWRVAMARVNPKVFTFVEQADWGFGAEFLRVHDGAFTKPFEFAARDAIRAGDAARLYDIEAQTLAACHAAGHGTFLGILGDHDVDRLASAIGADSAATSGRAHAAAAVLMLQPFTPIIYMGDEIGMLGRKAPGDGTDDVDISMREPFKWTAVNSGTPMTNYDVLSARMRDKRYSKDHDGRSVREQQGVKGSLLEEYRRLIALRKRLPALRRGDYTSVACASPHVWAFVRRAPSQTLLVAVNLTSKDEATFVDINGSVAAGPMRDAVSGIAVRTVTPENARGYKLTIPPYGFRVLERMPH